MGMCTHPLGISGWLPHVATTAASAGPPGSPSPLPDRAAQPGGHSGRVPWTGGMGGEGRRNRKNMEKLWETMGKTMEKLWKSQDLTIKTMGKSGFYHPNYGKSQDVTIKTMGNPCDFHEDKW